jgi:hypothetical protein
MYPTRTPTRSYRRTPPWVTAARKRRRAARRRERLGLVIVIIALVAFMVSYAPLVVMSINH